MKRFTELFGPWVRSMRCRRPAKGFSLIEVMVVVACITILAAAATPTLRQYLRMVNLRQAVYQISGDLYTVRSQAVKSGVNCSIAFDDINNNYTISSPVRLMDLSTYRGNLAFTADPDPGALPENAFSPLVVFNARGLSGLGPPVTTQVYVTNQDNYIFRVQVTATGAISVRRWNSHNNKWVR